MSDFHHGVQVLEINDGTRVISTVANRNRRHGLYSQRCGCGNLSPQRAGTDYQCAKRHCESR